MGKMSRARMFISGRVQGVCFRAYTCEEATRLGLKGMVKNLGDGRVEVLAEGSPEGLKLLEEFCWKGPPYARVLNVEVLEEQDDGNALPPFGISH